jgi:hypothetical protein
VEGKIEKKLEVERVYRFKRLKFKVLVGLRTLNELSSRGRIAASCEFQLQPRDLMMRND